MCKVLVGGEPKKINHLEDVGTDGRLTFMDCTNLAQDRQQQQVHVMEINLQFQ